MLQNVPPKTIFFFLIVCAVALEVVADVLFKKWSIENKNIILFAGLALYSAGTIFWAFSLKFEFLSKAVSVFTVLNLVVVALAGIIIFGENLSLANKIGICLGIASIILIEI